MTPDFRELLSDTSVLAILRGLPAREAVALAERAWDLGLTTVEVTIETPSALPSLRAVVAAGRERGLQVGAGTVIDTDQVADAAAAGAAFTVAPGLDPEVARASTRAGLPHLPGVATPTDIQQALTAGFHWLKGFPANVLGPAWFHAVRQPFPDVRLVATGGIDAHNAAAFLEAGAVAVAVGSALADPAQVERLGELHRGAGR